MGLQGKIFQWRNSHGCPDTFRRFLEEFETKIRRDLKVLRRNKFGKIKSLYEEKVSEKFEDIMK